MRDALSQSAVTPRISVIVPIKDEVDTLEELVDRISATLGECGREFEIILVDDGSTDGSIDRIESICASRPEVKALLLRRNFGKALALEAGFEQARGELFITMDADLQDVPEEIPKLLAEIDKGYDLVSGWKLRRQDPLAKRLPSRLFNATVSLMIGHRLHDYNCGFKCYRREIFDEVHLYGELHRFVPVLAHARGFSVSEVVVEHCPREHGESKYGLKRLPKGFFDLLTVLLTTRYVERPLHFFGAVGGSMVALGVLVLAYISVGWLFGQAIAGRPLFFMGILLVVVGGQITSTGLLAELFVKAQSSDGSNFSVGKKLNLEP